MVAPDSRVPKKTMVGQTDFDKNFAAKDEHVFGFLKLVKEHSEHELERAIVANIEHSLRGVRSAYA